MKRIPAGPLEIATDGSGGPALAPGARDGETFGKAVEYTFSWACLEMRGTQNGGLAFVVS